MRKDQKLMQFMRKMQTDRSEVLESANEPITSIEIYAESASGALQVV